MIQVRTDAEMVPVRREQVQAIADFLYRKLPMAESEQMVGWLREAVTAHEREKAKAQHAALTAVPPADNDRLTRALDKRARKDAARNGE